jgi:hypothetical protein
LTVDAAAVGACRSSAESVGTTVVVAVAVVEVAAADTSLKQEAVEVADRIVAVALDQVAAGCSTLDEAAVVDPQQEDRPCSWLLWG